MESHAVLLGKEHHSKAVKYKKITSISHFVKNVFPVSFFVFKNQKWCMFQK